MPTGPSTNQLTTKDCPDLICAGASIKRIDTSFVVVGPVPAVMGVDFFTVAEPCTCC
jgi:hypothetical protein